MGANQGAQFAAKRAAFEKAWNEAGGSPIEVARALGITDNAVYKMREALSRAGVILTTTTRKGSNEHGWKAPAPNWPKRRQIVCKDRCIIVGSDAHFWPGIVTTAWRAFCRAAKQLEPQYVVMNGDTFDGATTSRHDPIGWEQRPTTQQELEACQERLGEVEKAAPNAKKLKTWGNHDSRFDRKLAVMTPQYQGVPGMSLVDHLPGWQFSMSIMVNGETEPVMIKHAFNGGVHAVYNNTLRAGISIVTGHLHKQLCRPWTDYRGTRYGVDSGTLADIDGDQFDYTTDNPVDWRSGFAVLTFDKKGRLQPPELCEVQTHGKEQAAFFRGKIIAEGRLED